MTDARIINVVSVPRCSPTESGAHVDMETDQGQRLELTMTAAAFRQWSEGCTCPPNTTQRAGNAPPTSMAVTSFSCTAGPEHVLMRLSHDACGASTEFLLSEGDAVLLSVHLLEAARAARKQTPQS